MGNLGRPRGSYSFPYFRSFDITKHPEYNVDEKRCTVCKATKPAMQFDVVLSSGRSRLADVCLKCEDPDRE